MLSREIWVQYQSFEHLDQAWESSSWLTEAEQRERDRYRDEGRLRQWTAGRWLAKKLLSDQLVPWSIHWSEIEILSRDGQNRAVRPVVSVQGNRQPWCVSISHSSHGVLVGVSLNSRIAVGVDLAEKEEFNPHSLVFWFSEAERDRLRDAGARSAAACWAVKEAVYKAINTGESFVPRKLEVFSEMEGAYDCHYDGKSLKERSRIFTWDVDNHVAVTAIVANTAAALSEVPEIGGKAKKEKVASHPKHELVGIT